MLRSRERDRAYKKVVNKEKEEKKKKQI